MTATKPPQVAQIIEVAKEIGEIMRCNDLDFADVSQGDFRIRLGRRGARSIARHDLLEPAVAGQVAQSSVVSGSVDRVGAGSEVQVSEGEVVKSPMVGMAFLSPEPGAATFVSKGARVGEGDTLLIIDAMKTFNHVPAPFSGEVVEVLVGDGTPVEFDQPLVRIKRA